MKKQLTVKDLRRKGFRVVVRHLRFSKDYPQSFAFKCEPYVEKGGRTEVNISYNDKTVAVGKATCCDIDNYNKKLGVTIALGRALKSMNIFGDL